MTGPGAFPATGWSLFFESCGIFSGVWIVSFAVFASRGMKSEPRCVELGWRSRYLNYRIYYLWDIIKFYAHCFITLSN